MDEPEDLEQLLRQGLRPRQAPAGFTARVIAHVPETSPVVAFQKEPSFWAPFRTSWMRWVTATLLLGFAGGSYWQYQQQERIAGERARNQLILALRMSATTLNDVQHKVLRSTKGDSE
jgi:hypothetical protein